MKFLSSINHKLSAFAFLLFASISTSAHATLPAGVGTFFSDLTADWLELLDTYLYPIMFVIVGGLIILKLVKMGAKKATS